jgi:hypothetical protein
VILELNVHSRRLTRIDKTDVDVAGTFKERLVKILLFEPER